MGTEHSTTNQEGGYFPQLPPEMNAHVGSFLDVENAMRIRRTNREASQFRPTEQNLHNTSNDLLYSYVESHPKDTKALETLFWRHLNDPLEQWILVKTEDPRIQNLIRDNADRVMDVLFNRGVDFVEVVRTLEDLGVDYESYITNRITRDARTMTYEQLLEYPMREKAIRPAESIIVGRFGRERANQLFRHWIRSGSGQRYFEEGTFGYSDDEDSSDDETDDEE